MAHAELGKLQDYEWLQLPVSRSTPQDPAVYDLLSKLKRENALLRKEIDGFKRLSFTDPLTNLHNRRYFENRMSEEVSRARRMGLPLSLLVIDLDDFKQINDRFGHVRGDSALCWVADLLVENTRCHDVCFRLGGDEFAVILSDTDSEQAQQLTERLYNCLDTSTRVTHLPLGWSIGIATYGDGDTLNTLFARADAAMYRAKNRRKKALA